MALTVSDLRDFLSGCGDDDHVVIRATLGDGTVVSVVDLVVGTGQGDQRGHGDGDADEVCIDWEPGAEVVTT